MGKLSFLLLLSLLPLQNDQTLRLSLSLGHLKKICAVKNSKYGKAKVGHLNYLYGSAHVTILLHFLQVFLL